MNTEPEQARLIAERIARRVSGGSGSQPSTSAAMISPSDLTAELLAMRAGLSELQKRLAQIEAKVRSSPRDTTTSEIGFTSSSPGRSERPVPLTHSPWLAGVNASVAHPSQEKFGVEEATVSELVDFFEKEKTCSLEPGGKPCDHCERCSSRGF
ncbi:MAG: hypothetical protein H0V18_03450 [Pyrinomonadaceae bacterium]|nr:hypothetical protein [Pyrinomonadaceae bacterium]